MGPVVSRRDAADLLRAEILHMRARLDQKCDQVIRMRAAGTGDEAIGSARLVIRFLLPAHLPEEREARVRGMPEEPAAHLSTGDVQRIARNHELARVAAGSSGIPRT